QIVRFDYAKDGLKARGIPIAVPPEMRRLPSNKGIECLVMGPKDTPLAGTLIAISEQGLDAQANMRAFLIKALDFGTFRLQGTDNFDVSDCTTTPRGDLLILERRFSIMRGVGIRIRRVPLAQIKPGALLDGPDLLIADLSHQIDNMEGIAVHRNAAGELVLTL